MSKLLPKTKLLSIETQSVTKEKKMSIFYKGTLVAKSIHKLSYVLITPKTTVQASLSHSKTMYINLTELQATKEQLRITESFRWEKTLRIIIAFNH